MSGPPSYAGLVADAQTPEMPEDAATEGYLHDLEPTFGQAFGAEYGGQFGPGVLQRQYERGAAPDASDFQRGLRDPLGLFPAPADAPKLTPEEANREWAPEGTSITDHPITAQMAQILGHQKAEQIQRDNILSRFHNTYSWAPQLGTGIAAFMMDPISAATAFVPGIGEDAILASAGVKAGTAGVATRLAARAASGFSGGVAAQAPLSGVRLALSDDIDQYDMRQAFLDMMFAGGLNAIIHTGIETGREGYASYRIGQGLGALRGRLLNDAARMTDAPPQARYDAMSTAVGQIVTERPVDVGPVFDAAMPRDGAPSPANVAEAQERLYREGYVQGLPQDDLRASTAEAYGPSDTLQLTEEQQKAAQAAETSAEPTPEQPSAANAVARYPGESEEAFAARREVYAGPVPHASELPEDATRYFVETPDTVDVPLNRIDVGKPVGHERIVRASQLLAAGQAGRFPKRQPVSLRSTPSGRLEIVDGNATVAMARELGWRSLPAIVDDAGWSRVHDAGKAPVRYEAGKPSPGDFPKAKAGWSDATIASGQRELDALGQAIAGRVDGAAWHPADGPNPDAYERGSPVWGFVEAKSPEVADQVAADLAAHNHEVLDQGWRRGVGKKLERVVRVKLAGQDGGVGDVIIRPPGQAKGPGLTEGQMKVTSRAFLASQAGWDEERVFSAAVANQKLLDSWGENLGVDGARWVKAPAKSRERFAQKIAEKGVAADKVTDVVRASVAATKPEAAEAAIAKLATKSEVLDEGWRRYPGGYVDRKLLVRMPDGQVAEVIVLSERMQRVKDAAHLLLDRFRGMKPDVQTDRIQKEALAEQRRDFFGPAEVKDDGPWQGIYDEASEVGKGGKAPRLLGSTIAADLRHEPVAEPSSLTQAPSRSANTEAASSVSTKAAGSPSQSSQVTDMKSSKVSGASEGKGTASASERDLQDLERRWAEAAPGAKLDQDAMHELAASEAELATATRQGEAYQQAAGCLKTAGIT